MAKVKNKKSNLADSYAKRRKQQQTKKTLTPFEVHVNRDKQKVLGRKSKADTGLPGIARTKAIAKRKNTLLNEYKVRDKDNIFLDRRIGERNSGMTQEDKAMARFAAERVKAHSKKNIFNLNDEEVLTHRGQSLMDIEKYDDPRSDEDDYSDDENKTGKLDKKFVGDAHFGGGVLSKPDSEMSRKDLIEQLIVESKKRKAERQKVREQTIDLTEKLDSEWRDLLPLVASSNKALKEVELEKPKADDYDIAMRELKFEARGMPTDKLKPEEQIAKEEKVKLEKLEEDRLARMKGFSEEAEFQRKHKSADDLDDFHIERIVDEGSDNENDAPDLQSILAKHKNKIKNNENIEADDGDEDEEAEEDEDEEGEEDENEEVEEGSEDENLSEEADEDDGEEEDGEESEDDLSDLKESESSEDEEEIENIDINNKEKATKRDNIVHKKTESVKDSSVKSVANDDSTKGQKSPVIVNTETVDESTENTESYVNIEEREAIMEKARQELPYTFKAPAAYEELLDLFKDKNPDYQAVIVERIVKCNHWKLAERNKEKLLNLFSYLMQYLDTLASVNSLKDTEKFFKIFDRLCPHLYDLTQANPVGTKIHLQEILKQKHDQFENNIKVYPGLDTLFLFKLVSIIYPTSDFRHPIVTPCLVFMSQILLRCKVKKKSDISKGLFVCTLILEYTVLSKRWSPAVINYLRGVIYVSLPKPFSKVIKVIPPFKSVGDTSNILVLEENHKKSDIDPATVKMQIEDLVEVEMDDDYRLRTFVTALNLLCEFEKHCSELDAAFSIFEPILTLFECGSVKRYPSKVREKVKTLIDELKTLKEKVLEPLAYDKKKPKALRMYEPRIEVVHDGKRHKPMSKEKAEREKLLHKLKKETKSAIREIRRDNDFISKVKIKQQIASDAERKRKVKEIFGDAAMQQSELKKFKKQK
ncbi:hypothetical protein TSAR_015178 [Trichomalopsis sarcophagae]|uniref:Nucleolar protein 14 n=1 Tax=Trichomalopsis sarcophagae TaxID=543379 RepID=A0A232FET7_9HYME|nr:hypothetical protein TSAR_015178 [Trichomalopsis sarcophagae]